MPRSATVTPTIIINIDVDDNESPFISETCTDEENTGTSSVSTEEMTEQTNVGMEILLKMTNHLLQAEAMLSITTEELIKMAHELSQVQSQLKAKNKDLAKAKEELPDVKKRKLNRNQKLRALQRGYQLSKGEQSGKVLHRATITSMS